MRQHKSRLWICKSCACVTMILPALMRGSNGSRNSSGSTQFASSSWSLLLTERPENSVIHAGPALSSAAASQKRQSWCQEENKTTLEEEVNRRDKDTSRWITGSGQLDQYTWSQEFPFAKTYFSLISWVTHILVKAAVHVSATGLRLSLILLIY